MVFRGNAFTDLNLNGVLSSIEASKEMCHIM